MFSTNYRWFQDHKSVHNLSANFLSYFDDSQIIQEKMHRSLLYFNLPEDLIKKQIEPQKIWSWHANESQKNLNSLIHQFNQIETLQQTKKKARVPVPTIILI